MEAVPGHPFRYGRPRHLKAFSHTGLDPATGDDELDELAAPFRSERGIEVGNVRDEGLRGIS